jgi:site-specific recombinase
MRIQFGRGPSRKELDILLGSIPSNRTPLWKRIEWLRELLMWVFSESPLRGIQKTSELDFSTGHPQALRVKWLMHVLERNPKWKSAFQTLIQSVVTETRVFELLVSMGLHQHSSLISEFFERFQRRILPRPPDDQNLEMLFNLSFDDESDAVAIARIDRTTFSQIAKLLTDSSERNPFFSNWQEDCFNSTAHLSLQIAALGSHPALRTRSLDQSRGPSSFARLQLLNLEWLQTSDKSVAIKLIAEIRATCTECIEAIASVYAHMDENGVSIDLVFHLERTKALISRYSVILKLFEDRHFSAESVQNLAARLVFDCVHSNSIRALIDDNTALIAKKIAENSAETGEHYIAKTKQEEAALFRSALGGGAITAVTTIFKFLIAGLPGAPFLLSLLASANYSISFLTIQFQGFTLATKQPAMTAATLANQIQAFDDPVQRAKDNHEENVLQPIVNEALALFRSQTLAVAGNLLAVIPGVFLLCGVFDLIVGQPFVSKEKALKSLESISLLGPTPLYAAWTGVLLFTSSLIAGWFYHWVMFRRLPQAFARSPRICSIMGTDTARKTSFWFRKNSAGLAANISLGFLLGLSPAVFEFLGVPLDVRHVTLSTGSLVASVMALGFASVSTWGFWLAVMGIGSMAVLNLVVSFSLALAVALRSKKISFRTGLTLIKSFLVKLARNPLILFRPIE